MCAFTKPQPKYHVWNVVFLHRQTCNIHTVVTAQWAPRSARLRWTFCFDLFIYENVLQLCSTQKVWFCWFLFYFLSTYVDDDLRNHGGSLLYQDNCVASRHWSWFSFVFPSLFIRLGFGEGKQILDLYLGETVFFLSFVSWTARCLECESAVVSLYSEGSLSKSYLWVIIFGLHFLQHWVYMAFTLWWFNGQSNVQSFHRRSV